jgi:hypothetical protein
MTTSGLLTTSEAAAVAGVTPQAVARACREGRIEAVSSGDHGRRSAWIISRTALDAWVSTLGKLAGIKQQSWTDADDAALVELQATCTLPQVAAYLGRTTSATQKRWAQLLASGTAERVQRFPQWANPFAMPAGSILIAKSCSECGKVRDARYFPRRANGGRNYDTYCSICSNRRRRIRRPDVTCQELLQEVTFPQAVNEGKRYESADMEVIEDMTLSEVEVALSIGRSYYAIRTKRSSMGLLPPRPRKDMPDSEWRLILDGNLLAAAEHFRHLGEPVPEELWEWSDDDVAVAS